MSEVTEVTDGTFVFREYIWLDGTVPTPRLRSKTRIEQRKYTQAEIDEKTGVQELQPIPPQQWTADGSSTQQAQTNNSEIILKPVLWTTDPLRENSELVLCEVYRPTMEDGKWEFVPCWSNERAELAELIEKLAPSTQPWFGFEQEYFLISPRTWKPIGLQTDIIYKDLQSRFYCSVGADKVYGRDVAQEHSEACAAMLASINHEVAPGQWKFQVDKNNPLMAADHLILCRYLLERIAEKHGLLVSYDPKPLDSYNGSGCHVNFSTSEMRGKIEDEDSWEWIEDTCKKLANAHNELVDPEIGHYGFEIERRLTGEYETCTLSGPALWGVGDRGKAIRIPILTAAEKKGYIEDRRPCANIDPYTVCRRILELTCVP
jgi:glutamine synthetase